jgi:hypothetical protein
MFTHEELRCDCLHCGPQFANRIWREIFIKEYHAAPTKTHKIIEEYKYNFSLQYKKNYI